MEYYREAVAYLEENGIEAPEDAPEQAPEDAPEQAPEQASEQASEQEPAALPCGCPGSAVRVFSGSGCDSIYEEPAGSKPSRLRQWPVQLMLVPASAPYLDGAELVVAADCVPFAFNGFHEEFLAGKILLVGCPKLDDAAFYVEKMAEVFERNHIRSVTVVRMEVPCCAGLDQIVKEAVSKSGKTVPYAEVVIGIRGNIQKASGRKPLQPVLET